MKVDIVQDINTGIKGFYINTKDSTREYLTVFIKGLWFRIDPKLEISLIYYQSKDSPHYYAASPEDRLGSINKCLDPTSDEILLETVRSIEADTADLELVSLPLPARVYKDIEAASAKFWEKLKEKQIV